MNKRSIFFILLLTVAFYFINNWFFTKPYEAPTTQSTQTQNYEENLIALSQLPIVQLFNDPKGSQPAANAIKVHNQYLIVNQGSTLPPTLYAPSIDGKTPLEVRIPMTKGSPLALYTTNFQEELHASFPPADTKNIFQMVYFPNGSATNTVGIFDSGRMYFPLNAPTSTAIALYEAKGEYLPYGVYEPSSSSLIRLDDIKDFSPIIYAQQMRNSPVSVPSSEQFYVLQNDLVQLVFSNIGGALAEINLPFTSKTNTASQVRPVEFDNILAEDYSSYDYFPASGYRYFDPSSNKITEVASGKVGGYYPLIRRNIFNDVRHANIQIPPNYYACNVVSDDPSVALAPYVLKKFDNKVIEFESSQKSRRIVKTYTLPTDPTKAPYCFDLSIRVEGDSRGLFLTSGIPEVELISGNWTPALKYRTTKQNKGVVEQIDLPKTTSVFSSIQLDWLCNSNGYFGIIIDPQKQSQGFSSLKIPGDIAPTRLSVIDSQYDLYPAIKYPGYELLIPLPNNSQTTNFRIYAGPLEKDILQVVDKTYSDPTSGYNPDYAGSISFHGWFAFISEPFAKFLFLLMQFFHLITHSWGLSIILLTVALRIMLYPLNAWSIKSTARMQEISPQVKILQEKYKKDPKRAQIEIMNLYREKKVNPFTGCLPLLIQMPFLIGMFDLLKSTFELRGAPFIPGWINDLAAPDVVFRWSYPIIFFGTSLHLLPILLGAVMYFQQKMSAKLPRDPKLLTDQQKQQKMMGNVLTIVFTVMFYHFPSGLNIYWLSSMLLGIFQQWYTTKKAKNIEIQRV